MYRTSETIGFQIGCWSLLATAVIATAVVTVRGLFLQALPFLSFSPELNIVQFL